MSCESSDYNAGTPPDLNFLLPKLEDIDNKPKDWSMIRPELPIDILLITGNGDEFIACYSYMTKVQRSHCMKLGIVDFGRFGDESNQDVKVALMRHTKGSSATQTAVTNAAGMLCPKVTLLVGICDTMKPEKARIGDVVISAKLATYDGKIKLDGTVEYRGSILDVSRHMAKLILYAADGWKPPLKDPNSLQVKVHREALMLSGSGSKNRERLQDLKKNFPEALVIEIEGIGLYKAAYDLNMEWAIIKGVSDLADGSEEVVEDWKRFSSAMAASVVHNMFKYGAVLQYWSRHNEANGTHAAHYQFTQHGSNQ